MAPGPGGRPSFWRAVSGVELTVLLPKATPTPVAAEKVAIQHKQRLF